MTALELNTNFAINGNIMWTLVRDCNNCDSLRLLEISIYLTQVNLALVTNNFHINAKGHPYHWHSISVHGF